MSDRESDDICIGTFYTVVAPTTICSHVLDCRRPWFPDWDVEDQIPTIAKVLQFLGARFGAADPPPPPPLFCSKNYRKPFKDLDTIILILDNV